MKCDCRGAAVYDCAAALCCLSERCPFLTASSTYCSNPAQFGGYIFRLSESQGAYLLGFGLAVDAVRFCHSAQALLMYSQWPADCAEYCGKTGG